MSASDDPSISPETEEDLRAKLIVPWLLECGFNESEVSLEFAFQVHIGHQKIARPRADVLVKLHSLDKNVMVIECKRESHEISEHDHQQAISYARLVQPQMPPLTIVTNGRKTVVLDTFTSQPLQAQDVRAATHAAGPSNGAEIEILRYEALKRIISMSLERLASFVQAEIEHYMQRKQRSDGFRPPFIHDLYTPRVQVQSKLTKFCESAGLVGALVGTAGIGKTSEVMAFALSHAVSNIIPFYVPLQLCGDVGDFASHVAQDVGMVFVGESASERFLQDLETIAISHGIASVLWILDDADLPRGEVVRLRHGIHRFLHQTRSARVKHKVLVAAQQTTVNLLLEGEHPIADSSSVFKIDVLAMSEGDRMAYVKKLEDYYGVSVSHIVSANPSILHMAALHKDNANISSTADTLVRYVRWRISRVNAEPTQIMAALSPIAKEILDKDGGRADVTIVSGLIRTAELAGLVSVTSDPFARSTVRFADDIIFFYIVAIHLWRLDRASPSDARWIYELIASNILARRALTWYILNFPDGPKWLTSVEERMTAFMRAHARIVRRIQAISGHPGNTTVALWADGAPLDPWTSIAIDDGGSCGRGFRWVQSIDEMSTESPFVRYSAGVLASTAPEAMATSYARTCIGEIAHWLEQHDDVSWPHIPRFNARWDLTGAAKERIGAKFRSSEFVNLESIVNFVESGTEGGRTFLKGQLEEAWQTATEIVESEFAGLGDLLWNRNRGMRIEILSHKHWPTVVRYDLKDAAGRVDVVYIDDGNRDVSWSRRGIDVVLREDAYAVHLGVSVSSFLLGFEKRIFTLRGLLQQGELRSVAFVKRLACEWLSHALRDWELEDGREAFDDRLSTIAAVE